MTEPTILMTGMFDMDNYGDLLFPLVAAHRLQPAGFRVQPVAPSASRPVFSDALPPIAAAGMLAGEAPVAGILVGGGYIIHAGSTDFLDHYRGADVGPAAGAGLWLGASLAGALQTIPVAWNAPGVPHPFTSRQHRVIAPLLAALAYWSVRDQGSARLLGEAQDLPAAIVPDPITELPRLWPRAALAADFRQLLARKKVAGEPRFLAVHVRNRSMAGLEPAWLGAEIGRFAAAHGLTPLLIGIGASHDDPAVARSLTPFLGVPHLLLDDATSLRQITAALAHSELYLGASLHGYIVSTAYGVPGVLLGRPAYHKFSGYLAHTGRTADLAGSWPQAFLRAEAQVLAPACDPRPPAAVQQALDLHWQRILAAFRAPAPPAQAFLHAVLRMGLEDQGLAWALDPFLNRRMRATAGAKGDMSHGSR